ncbi:MAG: polymer-forming cytoskeletal protein [Bdellovibrionales bacterium]|nr:polymer-forming cytoskeletal protein [Bdellovibrionales bacterium]
MAFGKEKGDESSTTPYTQNRSVEAFLGQGSKVTGNLNFTGPVELDGFIEGEIDSKGRLDIGEGAVINARITGTEIRVRGTVNGDITATERLSLLKPAKIVGNITSSNLSIEEGVVFEGTCSMKRQAPQLTDASKDAVKAANK